MAFLTQAVSFILVVVLCIQHSSAQSVPDRCWCLSTFSKAFRWKNIEEFSIIAPRTRCKSTEIIVTLKTVNAKKKEKEQRCISPEIYQGKYLQECWDRLNKDGSRANIKMSECAKNTATNTESSTTVKPTSSS